MNVPIAAWNVEDPANLICRKEPAKGLATDKTTESNRFFRGREAEPVERPGYLARAESVAFVADLKRFG